MGQWVWGGGLCYGLPLFQGTSIFISTLTLMAIAIDRYFVICHHSTNHLNINEHMSMQVCIAIITLIWSISLLLVMPYAVHMRMAHLPKPCNIELCIEDWAVEELKSCYGLIVMALQFVIPFIIIGYSYTKIWHFLNRRNQKTLLAEKESIYETQRKKRLLRMLITMVVLFAICWLPLNLLNLLRDLKLDGLIGGTYKSFPFLTAHLISMTTTCWNPILYAWMNESFRDEFLYALPCLRKLVRIQGSGNRPRVITDCEPASNRLNCGDYVGKRKSLKTVTSTSTLGTFRENEIHEKFDSEMFPPADTATPTDESPSSDDKRQSFGGSSSHSRSTSFRSNPRSPRSNGVHNKPQEEQKTFSIGDVLPSKRFVFWKKPHNRNNENPSPKSTTSEGSKFVELKSRLI
uniref:G-protein coupled receptors family 1 profile domain-containing protein n=1 Tax=Acrobeloides nanus TaxID=290746 RepID=A0A914D7Z2_9BILA